jgi:amino-acid N-acetyltransferase
MDFVQWFRAAAPYIHAHRGKVFVLHIGGELIKSAAFHHLIHDIALLNSLGIRLVVCFGARPQIESLLRQQDINPRIVNGLRVTDAAALPYVKQAIGAVRIQIEASLSMGLPNSPMAGARVKVASGNFVMAKPAGVINGVDLEFTGMVRRIDAELIKDNLDNHEIVLVPPLGYSPTGEVFNLSSVEVATRVSTSLHSDKLLFLMMGNGFRDQRGNVIQHMTQVEAEAMLAEKELPDETSCLLLTHGAQACLKGVERIHFIDQSIDGNLMLELFSRDGVGTMLSKNPFDQICIATFDDIGGILELIRPLEEKGILVLRSREKMEREIDDYIVLKRDGTVIACAALHVCPGNSAAELACLVVSDEYQKQSKGRELYLATEKTALGKGVRKLFVLTTHTTHWFLEQGFVEKSVDDLPVGKKELYNYRRNSKILIKQIGDQ